MRRLMTWLGSRPRWLLPLLVVPNVVALPAVGWLGTRPAPWNWVLLTLVCAYLLLTTVTLQREWNKDKRHKHPSPGRHAAPGK